jgi:hypothetical protein
MTRLTAAALALPVLLSVCACSRQEPASEQNSSSEQRDENATAPNIGITSAPGITVSYDYRFGLESGKIATLQERHAAACEALGLDKCRITGLSFSRRDKDHADGTLELALAPNLARKFGKDATAAVEMAKGTVAAIDIASEDKNPALNRSATDIEAAQAESARIEAQLAGPELPKETRAELLRQITRQKAAERDAKARGTDVRETLANTPMRFTYSTDGFLPGFSLDRTAWAAFGFAGVLLNALLAIIVVLGTLAIPAGLILLGLAYGRKGALRLWIWLAPRSELEQG